LTVSAVIELAEIPVCQTGLDGAVLLCSEHIAARRGGYVCFVNVHSLTEATKHAELRAALKGAAFCFADGLPLLWLSRLKRGEIATRVAGPDFMTALLKRETTRVHGFIGGVPGQAQRIADRFGIRSVIHCPPVRAFSRDAAIADWNAFVASCPDHEPPELVWVALGAPKQEHWMSVVSEVAPKTMFLGVGAAFGFLSGATSRAPLWLQRAGLEWAHRLASEPRRLWKRYLVSSVRFVRLAARELM
jgi:N-acetylglucosaminyldiphosphoundecaprenol N-acetyl-beta-D-mannosaminyltransferase